MYIVIAGVNYKRGYPEGVFDFKKDAEFELKKIGAKKQASTGLYLTEKEWYRIEKIAKNELI